jgi:putative peptidoglycan lipid II flippase
MKLPAKKGKRAVNNARSIVGVNALVFGSLGIGLLSNVVIAAVFGLTRRVDAFYAAFMVPNLVMVLCVDYLGKNFLPMLALAKQEGEESAARMTSSVVTITGLFAVGLSALLAFFAEPIFRTLLPGFHGDDTVLVSRYFAIMAPAIVLMTINTFHEYVCQYDERYVLITAVKIALPAANLAAIAVLSPFIHEYCLPVGFLLGHFACFLMLAYYARYRYAPTLKVRAHLERRIFTNSAVVMSTGFIARTKSLLMNYLASNLGHGAISAMALAQKLAEPLERSAFSGIRLFLFSRTAKLFVERDERALAGLYRTGMRVSFLLLAPVLAWICMNSGEIVRAFFARGEFTAENAALVAATLTGLIPSVLFIGVAQLLSNAFYAMDRVRVPALVMPIGTVIYVAASIPLSKVLGTQGLALATTITSGMMLCVLFYCLSRMLHEMRPGATAFHLLGYSALGIGAMGGTVALLGAFGLSPAVVATASLPLGAALHFGALFAFGDGTFERLREYARGMFVRRAAA